jgi:hypothetical protein
MVLYGTMLALAPGAAFAQPPFQAGFATIVRVQGEARYMLLGDTNWYPLVAGKVLGVGTIIQTSHDGIVDMVLGKAIEFPQAAPVPDRIALAPDAKVRGMVSFKPAVEQNMIRMMGDTVLGLDELVISDTGLDTVSETELNLKYGRVFASVKKISAPSKYFIKIPAGVAGVRGTFFEIDASGWCAVLKHSVLLALADADGGTAPFTINEGYQFDPATGQITPLPSNELNRLQEAATSLDTTYVSVVSFENDGTSTFISPVTGHY